MFLFVFFYFPLLVVLSCPFSYSLLSLLISDSRFDLVWFRLSCDHGWIRSGSVNVRKTTNNNNNTHMYILYSIRGMMAMRRDIGGGDTLVNRPSPGTFMAGSNMSGKSYSASVTRTVWVPMLTRLSVLWPATMIVAGDRASRCSSSVTRYHR